MLIMYYVGSNGQQTGPYSVEQLTEMATAGQLRETDLVWREGMAGWEPARTVEGVFSAAPGLSSPGDLGTAPPPVPAAAPYAEATLLPPLGATAPRQNPLAVAGLVLGIFSVTLGLCCCSGIPFSLSGLVCSIIALNQIKADPSNQTGRGLALGGLWCSIANLVLAVLLMAIGFASLNTKKVEELMQKAQQELKQ
ncbi:MAG: GYF domain-containing protein [Roseimicrobium sp.]